MTRPSLSARCALGGVCAVLVMAPIGVAGQTVSASASASSDASPPRTAWGAPDLQGVWSSATVTPLERPTDLADKEFLTEEEAAEYSRQQVARRNTDIRRAGVRDVTSAYNNHWYDRGTSVVPTRRTSLVVAPPNGRIPALTEAARARVARSIPYSGFQDGRNPVSWLERGLWERCITRGVPNVMLPTAYNNHYQIFQTPDYVVILAEMIHDVRIIPLDGRPHLVSDIRQWMGDSRGRWEGDTARRRHRQLHRQDELPGIRRRPASGRALHACRCRDPALRGDRRRPDSIHQLLDGDAAREGRAGTAL